MAYLGDTGQGATVKFIGNSIAMVRTMTLPDWTVDKIDASILTDTGFMRYVPGDLADPGELQLELVFDPAIDLLELAGCGETILIEWPINPCRSNTPNTIPATLTGTGFVSTISYGNLALNELNTMTLTFTYDGGVGPAFTVES
tara:strand:+ start:3429 stop:3860 length:432 start_codon:yes stop_codon:yes gene_type:complete